MIHIYNNDNKNYKNNGDMILRPSSTKMSVKLNDKNDIEIEHDFDDDGRWKYIQPESVVKVPTPDGKYNLYQIYEVEKDMYCVRAYARHIFFNLNKRILIDCRPTNANGQQTLDKILEGTGFTGHSNITKTNTSHYIRKNILNALVSDDENSFFTKFGGELYLDNFDIYINDRVGIDTNIRFEYGKDIASIDDGVNTDEVYTRLIPVSFNGRTLPEYYVDSSNIEKYKDYKETTVSFDNYKLKEDFDEGEEPSESDIVFNNKEELHAALREACEDLFKGGIDKPTLNTTLEIVNLESTVEYKDFKNILQVGLGDRVTAYYKPLDIDISTRVIGYEFDCLSKEYISIELGETIRDFIDFNVDASNKINSILNSNKTVNASSIEGIINAFNTKFKAQRDIAQKQHIRAMLFEDLDPDSPTYGAMCIGSMGFEIASQRTPDGKGWDWSTFGSGQGFVADHIVTGILSTVLIQNADGSLQIDLSGTKGIMTKKNGKNAIEIAGTIIKFHDWDGEGEHIGQFHSTRLNDNENATGLVMANKQNSFLSLGYEKDDNFHSYMDFDKDRVNPNTKTPITIFNETEFRGSQLWFGYDTNSIYNSTADHFVNNVKNSFIIADKNTSSSRLVLNQKQLNLYDVTNDLDRYAYISPSETFFGSNGSKYFNCSHGAFSFWDNKDGMLYTTTANSICSNRDFHVNKNFTVSGTKNCIQTTKHYGDRLYYSVEDCESYLTDRSMELFTVEETNEGTFERIILLDNIYKESVNLDLGYTAEVIKQGWGDYRIKEQTKDYFIVEADREDFTFKYVITAKRAGFEEDRNVEFYEINKDINNANIEYLNSNQEIQEIDIDKDL